MIEILELYKSFGEVQALNGLNMKVERGSVYGLVGPNGSGKTTCMKHISGTYKADSGQVLMNGEEVYENVMQKSKIAFISDEVYAFPTASTLDMMKFHKGIYKSFDEERFNKLSKSFDIDPKQLVRKLSKGKKKQVAFWLALSLRPELLVLDEPFDGLDPLMRREVWSLLMDDVAENGTTVISSSHNLRELEDVCDHVGIISHGKMLVERNLSDLQENIAKVQLVLSEGSALPKSLNILNESRQGRMQVLIVRGKREKIEAELKALNPIFLDALPLSLEEIFIYEVKGEELKHESLNI